MPFTTYHMLCPASQVNEARWEQMSENFSY